MLNRKELKTEAKQALSGKWGLSGLAYILLLIVAVVLQSIPGVGPILGLLVTGPVTLGMVIYSLAIANKQNPGIETAFKGFENFIKALGLYLWTLLWTFLWTLLLIVPGIIKGLSYSMAFYILAENPGMSVQEALNASKKITDGYKMDLFILGLSFIGWGLLCLLTFGIGYFWFISYANVTYANAYKVLKAHANGNAA